MHPSFQLFHVTAWASHRLRWLFLEMVPIAEQSNIFSWRRIFLLPRAESLLNTPFSNAVFAGKRSWWPYNERGRRKEIGTDTIIHLSLLSSSNKKSFDMSLKITAYANRPLAGLLLVPPCVSDLYFQPAATSSQELKRRYEAHIMIYITHHSYKVTTLGLSTISSYCQLWAKLIRLAVLHHLWYLCSLFHLSCETYRTIKTSGFRNLKTLSLANENVFLINSVSSTVRAISQSITFRKWLDWRLSLVLFGGFFRLVAWFIKLTVLMHKSRCTWCCRIVTMFSFLFQKTWAKRDSALY